MSEESRNMVISDLKHYVIDNMSLDVQDDYEIICKYIKDLQQKVERLENIINELEKELELNLKFKVIGVRRLKDKLKELKEFI